MSWIEQYKDILSLIFIGLMFLYNRLKANQEAVQSNEEVKRLVRVEMQKANGVPFAYIKHLPLASWCKGADGVMIWINEEYTSVWGVKSTEYEGRTDEQVWGKKIADQFRKNDEEVINSRRLYYTIEMVPLRPGSKEDLIPYHIWKFPLFNEQGEVYAVGGIAKKKL